MKVCTLILKLIDQWLWLSWESCCIQFQRSAVRIQPPASLIQNMFYCFLSKKRNERKRKRLRIAHLRPLTISRARIPGKGDNDIFSVLLNCFKPAKKLNVLQRQIFSLIPRCLCSAVSRLGSFEQFPWTWIDALSSLPPVKQFTQWAVVVAQLVEQSLLKPEARGSNPAIDKIYTLNNCLLSTVLKRQK